MNIKEQVLFLCYLSSGAIHAKSIVGKCFEIDSKLKKTGTTIINPGAVKNIFSPFESFREETTETIHPYFFFTLLIQAGYQLNIISFDTYAVFPFFYFFRCRKLIIQCFVEYGFCNGYFIS
jgi:hypothetical protein